MQIMEHFITKLSDFKVESIYFQSIFSYFLNNISEKYFYVGEIFIQRLTILNHLHWMVGKPWT